ncbi:hypothetical protein ACFWM1_19815 [Nocardia sp. NPDC058379]|uniref:hypothetical protein n=1 Tax=unclassified Nocardia TaxID=2637762 RepID=UPI00364AD8D3
MDRLDEVRRVRHRRDHARFRIERPFRRDLRGTPCCFRLLLEPKRKYALTWEVWDPDDGETPRRERDREQPVRDLIAAEVSELGWRPGRSAVGWVITMLIATIKILMAVIAAPVLTYYLGR